MIFRFPIIWIICFIAIQKGSHLTQEVDIEDDIRKSLIELAIYKQMNELDIKLSCSQRDRLKKDRMYANYRYLYASRKWYFIYLGI